MKPQRQLKPRLKHPELPFGVYWRNRPKPYIAKIYRRKRLIYLGSFVTVSAAAAAVANATQDPTP